MSYLSYQYLVFIFLLFLIYYNVSSMHRWKVLLVGNIFFLICASSLIQVLMFFLTYTICFLSGRVIYRLPQGSYKKRTALVIAVSFVLCPFMISRICRFFWGGYRSVVNNRNCILVITDGFLPCGRIYRKSNGVW